MSAPELPNSAYTLYNKEDMIQVFDVLANCWYFKTAAHVQSPLKHCVARFLDVSGTHIHLRPWPGLQKLFFQIFQSGGLA